jgi:NAD(P)-dependent dehydrogenase (short-subunit alcohol dehydrogenase family)
MKNDSRVALITGGSRGIGLGIARALAAEGCRLAINGQRPAADVVNVVAELEKTAGKVIYCQGDVADADDRHRMLEEICTAFGRIDVLVNNAGITSPGRKDILDADEQSFDRVMGVNLKGPYFLTQSVARWMIDQHRADAKFRGCVINLSSVSAEVVSVSRGDYCLSRAGTSMATKLWAVRLAEFGIDVYEVRPGIVATDMTTAVKEKYDKLIAEGLTLERRWGTPEDVGRAVATLVRGDVPYATGQVLTLDGGMMIRRL